MATLTPQDIARLKAKMYHLKPLNVELFEKQLTGIDEKYPFAIPTWLELVLQIGMGATLLVTVGALLWFCIKHRSHLLALWKFGTSICSKLKENPNLFPPLLAQGAEFIQHQWLPSPPPRPTVSRTKKNSLAAVAGPLPEGSSKVNEPCLPALF